MSDKVTRALICDDNRDNMLTLGVLLRSEGYVVHLATNGAEALRLAGAFRPDVALLDLVMPDRSGFDVARELQRLYRNDCPVLIAITAQDDPLTKQQAQSTGFQHFVAKPYDPQALLRLVGSLDASD
jgi:CheY-like chemotaxis protein